MSLLLRYRKLGFTATLRVDAHELEELARDLHSSALEEVSTCAATIPADLVWQPAPDEDWQILLKGAIWGGGAMQKDALYLQSDSLLDDLVREQLQDFPLLHSGAVSDATGRTVVICGTSGAGKTSLVFSCILRGWNWLSDELLCFRESDPLVAEGFRRNFNLKERSFSQFPETSGLKGNREFLVADSRQRIRFFNPDALPGGKFMPSGRVRVFILPEYSPGAERPETAPLSGPALVQVLAPELRASQLRTFTWLAEIGRTVPAFRLRYRTPGSAAECVMNLMADL